MTDQDRRAAATREAMIRIAKATLQVSRDKVRRQHAEDFLRQQGVK